ncbi:MAG TPA: phosphoribosylglycinamide formyltransferase [Atribacteraceae bacterium]|nr:phosphoribosylglycinamide formyltransferase [Atribacteraceae bacterium]
MDNRKIAVLASGRGTNLQAILEACAAGQIPGRVSLVISDVPGAPALERARRANVPIHVLDYESFSGKKAYERNLFALLIREDPELVCLAGYMRIVGKEIIDRFRGRLLNIHPSLLPAFPGLDAQCQALEYGVKITGCTVHFVDEGIDTGPILLQSCCPVKDDDTVDTLFQRILQLEHALYPEAIRLVLEGKIYWDGRKTKVREDWR